MTSATRKSYSNIYSENPFIDDPLPKAFYYPSQFRQLSESEKHLALSPLRTLNQTPEIAEKKFLAASHTIKPLASTQTYVPKSPKSDNFDESWPDSERPSSSSLSTSEERTSQEQLPYASVRRHVLPAFTSSPLTGHAGQKTSEPPDRAAATAVPPDRQKQSQTAARSGSAEPMGSKVDENGSTLQRYVERFRHGAPLSREERLRQESQKQEFWWLDANAPAPNSASTPKEAEARSVSMRGREDRMLTAENLHKMDNLDALTAQLQEKAERLLSSTNSVSSSEPIVSTDGLGSTGSDVTGSSFAEPVVRPAFVLRGPGPYSTLDRAPPQGKAGKEDDILFKWRLQRKLEIARDGHYVPTYLHGPKSADEIEVQNRLRAYREKLLQHGSVVQTQLQEARTEKLTKQIQLMMDTGVQTSPAKSDNVWPTIPQSQPKVKLDCAAQVDDRGSFLFIGPSEPLSAVGPVDRYNPEKLPKMVSKRDLSPRKESLSLPTSYTNGECCRALGDSDVSQKSSSTHRDGSSSQPRTRTESTSGQLSRQRREVDQVPEPDVPSKGQGRVQYRQFLEAEKPDDRSDGERQPGQKHIEDSVSDDDARCKRAVSTSFGSPRPPKSVKTEIQPPTDEGDNHKWSLSQKPQHRSQNKQEHYAHARNVPCDSGDAPHILQRSTDAQEEASRVQHRKKREDESYDSNRNSNHPQNRSREKVTENRLRDGRGSSVEGRNSRDVSPASLNTNQNNSRRLQETEESSFAAANFQPEFRRASGEREQQSLSKVAAKAQGKKKINGKLAENLQGKESRNARVLPPPQHSSSPARGALSSAIGQVVHNHLFDVSGSVTSSIESLPSFQHSLQSPGVPQRLHPDGGDGATPVGDEAEFESDGEFADDPLLAMLRNQRQQYEQQLKHLDALLADRHHSAK